MYDRSEVPRRPALPPALYALVVVLVVERSILAEGVAWLDGWTGRVVVLCLVVLVVVAACVRSLWATCALMAVAASCAWVLGSVCVVRGDEAARLLASSAMSDWEFCLEGDPSEGSQGYRSRAEALYGGRRVAAVWFVSSESLGAGTTVCCVGRFVPLGDDEWAVSSRMQGICGTVRAIRVRSSTPPTGVIGLVNSVRTKVVEGFRPQSSPMRALLAGCVCGWRADLKAFELDKLFSRCGCAHLVAVSGGHLAVLVSLLGVALQAAALRPRARAAILAMMSGLFVMLCGAPPSAERAWAMSAVASAAELLGRRSHALSGVCVVGLAMALVEPAMAGRLGFVLSVASVCGLCIYSSYATYVMTCMMPRLALPRAVPQQMRRRILSAWSGICQSMATSTVACIVTLPLVAQSFGEVSVTGPLANAVVGLPFTLMVGVGIVAAVLAWAPPLQALVLWVADVLAAIVLFILHVVDALPIPVLRVTSDSLLPFACVIALVVVLIWWPQLSARKARIGLGIAVLCVVAVALRWRLLAPARICILDVGQGDAILVQDGPSAILVDAGPPDEAIRDALAREHVSHLDAIVVTHLHDDHYGGVISLVGHVACEEVVVAEGVAAHVDGELAEAVGALASGGVEEVGYGDVLEVGGFRLEVVSPVGPVEGDENADSLELLVRYERGDSRLSALLTGDAERDETGAALARGDLCDIDLLKVGHHGSEVSITLEQARELDPEVSVASAGEHNKYGHPNAACVEALEGAGSEFLCTKDVGDVEVRPGVGGTIVRCSGASLGQQHRQ